MAGSLDKSLIVDVPSTMEGLGRSMPTSCLLLEE
jgi:hypothetical protein